jgi:hypothetical protein
VEDLTLVPYVHLRACQPRASIKVRKTSPVDADLAQRMALVAHGNAFLSGSIDRPPDLLTANSAFQHVSSVEFQTGGRAIRRVDLWFSALARRGAKRLWVRNDDLAAEGDGVREVWLPSSVLISEGFEERRFSLIESLAKTGVWDDQEHRASSAILARAERPWHLYFKQAPRKSRAKHGMPLPAALTVLVEVVTEAREFSREHDLGFAGSFDQSLVLARSRNPSAPYHPDLLPAVGYTLEARQAVAAAAQAWVFGPWGWGDRVFRNDAIEAEFWRIDARLRKAVWGALIAAANSFDGPQKRRKGI